MTRVLAIAGASSGIGQAVAQHFLDRDWDVAVLARRLDRLEAWRLQAPQRILALGCDVTDPEEVAQAAARVAAWRPQLHALVVSAGDFLVAPLGSTPPQEFERMWRVNVAAKFLLLRAMQHQLAGRFETPGAAVLVASLAAHRDFPDETAYMSAMHGVIGLARAADAELRSRGIRVATVSPGLVRTPLTERSFDEATLAGALKPEAIAATVWHQVETIRSGGYIADVLHMGRL